MSRVRATLTFILRNLPLFVGIISLGVSGHQFYITQQLVWVWVGVLSLYIIPTFIARRGLLYRERAVRHCLDEHGLELEKTGTYEYTLLNDPNDN